MELLSIKGPCFQLAMLQDTLFEKNDKIYFSNLRTSDQCLNIAVAADVVVVASAVAGAITGAVDVAGAVAGNVFAVFAVAVVVAIAGDCVGVITGAGAAGALKKD